ncbi:SRPBCC domain-containing protein [Lederbergia citrea]|uniref:SRPBCC domain-containing protein n=1 Tax=Lederbergia citrea TaxID=2833581 RepID=UPI001BC9FFF6|nr:SRPBCC domain-containing protein [Lederbergia citrea]MBS4179207.1 SRPBCC domain-containing protein [Lederbergia citrea]
MNKMKQMSRKKKIISSICIAFIVILICLSFGSKRIYTEIEINASEEQVWAIISDLESYKEWNPFMTEAHGELKVGEQLDMKLHNGSLTLDPFNPTLLQVRQGKEINWIGRVANIPRLFDGNHHLVIEPMSNGNVKFIQYEDFQGIIVSLTNLFQKGLFDDTQQGFEKMNNALKIRAE